MHRPVSVVAGPLGIEVPTFAEDRPILKIKIAEFSELPDAKPPDSSDQAFME